VLKRFIPIIALTALCWLVLGLNNLVWQGSMVQCGIAPRHLSGLLGIIWAPFLHASVAHLAANTLPLLVLGGILCGRSSTEFAAVTVLGIVLTGGLTWLFGRSAFHIGASGLIFCYFGYLASLAWFRRTFGTFCLSLVCILGYGGLIRGIVPTSAPISWESHLAGLIAGIALASMTAKLKKPSKVLAGPTGPSALPQ
jgi:membrane associated rhomboid family serine protease